MNYIQQLRSALQGCVDELELHEKHATETGDTDLLERLENARKALQAEPDEMEEKVKNASHYLCDSEELSIQETIELMEAEPDKTKLIDNVDERIIVWEAVENRFTIEEFLSLIQPNFIYDTTP